MENERQDWFSEGWAEDGGLTADSREDEALPPETGEEAPEDEKPAPAEGGEAEGTEGPAAPPVRGREADFLAFMEAYPQVEPGDIPPEVWRQAARGESLTAAYARFEAEKLRRENEYLRQSQRNRRRSAGSQQGAGAGDRRMDAFDAGWDEAY